MPSPGSQAHVVPDVLRRHRARIRDVHVDDAGPVGREDVGDGAAGVVPMPGVERDADVGPAFTASFTVSGSVQTKGRAPAHPVRRHRRGRRHHGQCGKRVGPGIRARAACRAWRAPPRLPRADRAPFPAIRLGWPAGVVGEHELKVATADARGERRIVCQLRQAVRKRSLIASKRALHREVRNRRLDFQFGQKRTGRFEAGFRAAANAQSIPP